MPRKNDFTPKEPRLFHDKDKEIIQYLKELPDLYFSEKGLFNICKRFFISHDQLEQYIIKATDEQKEFIGKRI